MIGSREFVERLSDQIYGEGKKRRFAEGQVSKGESLFFCVGCVCSGHSEQSGGRPIDGSKVPLKRLLKRGLVLV